MTIGSPPIRGAGGGTGGAPPPKSGCPTLVSCSVAFGPDALAAGWPPFAGWAELIRLHPARAQKARGRTRAERARMAGLRKSEERYSWVAAGARDALGRTDGGLASTIRRRRPLSRRTIARRHGTSSSRGNGRRSES